MFLIYYRGNMENIELLKESLQQITPVEFINNHYVKREDLYRPLNNTINGTKCREAIAIILSKLLLAQNGIITGSSVNSPQNPIIAQIGNFIKTPVECYYGGTNIQNISKKEYYNFVKDSKLNLKSKTGRNSVLKHLMLQEKQNRLMIGYGMDMFAYPELFKQVIAHQISNIPQEVKNIYLVCGSGITLTGIIIGLIEYNRNIKLHIINTAPSRIKKIIKFLQTYYSLDNKKYFKAMQIINDIQEIKLYEQKDFNYDKKCEYYLQNIKLHPRYEAKAYKYLCENTKLNNQDLFWIIGGDIL